MNKRVADVMAKRAAGEKGFTLIELLVVVIIMGILAAVAIPVFLNMREGAWKSSVESDVTNAVLAVEQAATANNGSLTGVVVDPTPGARDEDVDFTVPGQIGTEPVSTATVSDGNLLTVEITDQTYIITADNENVDGEVYEYNSEDGSGEWVAAP